MKKEFGLFFILGSLVIVFAIVSLLVFITRGHPDVIKAKLKLGAKIITLSALLNLNNCYNDPIITCYEPIEMSNSINLLIDIRSNNTISMNLKQKNIIQGTISNRKDTTYSFRIETGEGILKRSSDIIADDGEYNDYSEKITIKIENTLNSGSYFLTFYNVPALRQKDKNIQYLVKYLLIITE